MGALTIYIVHASNTVYGSFMDRTKAEEKIKEMYTNGYYGDLTIIESYLES